MTHALPIKERFQAPFTIFVTTGMVTRSIDAWWFGLAALIRSQERIELPDFGRRFDCPDRASKKCAFTAIESAIHNDFSLLPRLRSGPNLPLIGAPHPPKRIDGRNYWSVWILIGTIWISATLVVASATGAIFYLLD